MLKVCICCEEKAIVLRFPKTTRSGDAQKEKTVTTQWQFSSKTFKDWGVAQPGGLSLSAKAVVKDTTFVPPRAGSLPRYRA